MSIKTEIEWATSTGNPWIGCTKVSPGCKNCYAEALDVQRFSKTLGGGTRENPLSHWGKGAPRVRAKGFWKDALKWNAQIAKQDTWICSCGAARLIGQHKGCKYIDGRPRIFPSLCDWLDREVPIEWLADFLKLIYETPNLDWLLLTKRPENFFPLLQTVWRTNACTAFGAGVCQWVEDGKPPGNVWVGTSVEDQERADERIPELLKIPAKVRFLSVEPLLGPVDLRLGEWQCDAPDDKPYYELYAAGEGIHWVIVGGESGPGARLCNVEWVRSIVGECEDALVKCFVKQMGSNSMIEKWPKCEREMGNFGRVENPDWKHPKGGDPSEWPEDLRVREFPKV